MTDEYEALDLIELARLMRQTQTELDEAKAKCTALQKDFDELRIQVIPSRMEELGVKNITLDGVGRLQVTADMYVNTPANNRVAVQEWMREHDHAELISATINGSTLKAWVKEQMKNGEEIPTDLINISPFMRASITKA
jgi:hypothetical protein